MTIEEFAEQHEGESRRIGDVVDRWVAEKRVSDFLGTPIFAGVLIADAIQNGTLLDRLPLTVQAGFRELMGEASSTRDQMVERLVEQAQAGGKHLEGLLSKIQGQMGENEFVRSIGHAAQLAESGSQAGWDVSVARGAARQYVQVKVYDDADGVIDEIQYLQARIATGGILGVDGEPVRVIDVAVNTGIYDEVQRRSLELGLPTEILDLGVERDELREALETAADNATEPFEHFFGELLGDLGPAAVLHAAANGFLVWKGSKSRGHGVEDTIYSSAISGGGMAASLGLEALLEHALLGDLDADLSVLTSPVGGIVYMAAGMYVRGVLRRIGERRHVVERLEAGNTRFLAQSEKVRAFVC